MYLLVVLAVLFLFPSSALAQDEAGNGAVEKVRYQSLRSNEINSRTGPGMRYPVEWIYKCRDLPVQVIEQYDVWRKIRDYEGTTGWMHQGMLSNRRYGIITVQAEMKRTSDDESTPIALIEPNVIVKLVSCPKNSLKCRVEAKGKHGFVLRSAIWGVNPGEGI